MFNCPTFGGHIKLGAFLLYKTLMLKGLKQKKQVL